MAGTVMASRRLEVVAYEAAGLGDRSYMVHDGGQALVVDAQRDAHPYLETAADLGVEIALVLETHVHNDYVSGGLALARQAGAGYGVPGGVPFDFASESAALQEGDVLEVGALRIRVLSTPGHTPHHLAFLAQDVLGTTTVLTGGSLLSGATGRTDLLGPERAASLGEAQWHSVRRLLRELDPATEVLPTHGFGSFCSAGLGTSAVSHVLTVGGERLRNPAARLDLGAFVEEITANPLPIPAYYQHMAPLNRAGAAEPQYGPVPVIGPAALPQLMGRGAAVVDLRLWRQFADVHLRGALNIELGVNLPTYFGWLVPFSAPFVVVAPSGDELAECRRLLSRIGREDPVAWARADLIGSLPAELLSHYEVTTFAGLGQRYRDDQRPHVVDVRFPHEWRTGHIKGPEHPLAGGCVGFIHAVGGGEDLGPLRGWLPGSHCRFDTVGRRAPPGPGRR